MLHTVVAFRMQSFIYLFIFVIRINIEINSSLAKGDLSRACKKIPPHCNQIIPGGTGALETKVPFGQFDVASNVCMGV